jgi:hypothetical protein
VFWVLWVQSRSTRKAEALLAREQLAQLWGHLWADRGQWGDLKLALARLHVRLDVLGVSAEQSRAVEEVARPRLSWTPNREEPTWHS